MGAYGQNIPAFPHLTGNYPENHPDKELRGKPRYPGYSEARNGPYPKMVTTKCDQEYRTEFMARVSYIDDRTGHTCYRERAPKLNSVVPVNAIEEDVDAGFALVMGEPVIVPDEETEQTFHAHREAIGKPVTRTTGDPEKDSMNDRIRELERQLAAANAKPDGGTVLEPPKRRGRRPKSEITNPPSAVPAEG